MKDTLLPCLLPVLGRKFAVQLQICPTKVFLLWEKNNNSRHTNYDSSSPLKYTQTQKNKTKQKQEFQRSVYRFISLLADCLIEYKVFSRL